MSVESEVVGNQADVACEQRFQLAALAPVDPDGLVAPEHAVMDEHELHARRRRARSNSSFEEETPHAIFVT